MTQFLLVIVIAVAILIFMIVKLNIHPVLALFVGGILAGIGFGYPVGDALTTFTGGFGSTLGSIGCTIIFGLHHCPGYPGYPVRQNQWSTFLSSFLKENLLSCQPVSQALLCLSLCLETLHRF